MSSGGNGPVYAGFWRRLWATLLDLGLFTALTMPVLYLLYGADYFQWSATTEDLFPVYGGLDLLINYLLPFVLVVTFWLNTGATPGKRLLEIKVISADGSPLSPKQAVVRYLAYFLSALPLYIGFLWIAIDKRKQGFHDKIAKTLVVHAPEDEAEKSLQQLMEEAS